MLSAEQARQGTKGLETQLEKHIRLIEEEIQDAMSKGRRTTGTIFGGGRGYNNDIANHFREQGFKVEHYVAPWDELVITW